VAEGRVIANSNIGQDSRGPFAFAANFSPFAPQLAPGSPAAQQAAITQHPQPAPQVAPAVAQIHQPQPIRTHTQATSQAQQPQAQRLQEPVQTAPVAHLGRLSEQPNYASTQAVQANAVVYIVMAEIQSGSAMRFLQTLQNFGRAQRVGDTVWVLKSQASAQNLQLALSQTLTRQDRLFISATTAAQSAWFNLGADMDSRIKALWAE